MAGLKFSPTQLTQPKLIMLRARKKARTQGSILGSEHIWLQFRAEREVVKYHTIIGCGYSIVEIECTAPHLNPRPTG